MSKNHNSTRRGNLSQHGWSLIYKWLKAVSAYFGINFQNINRKIFAFYKLFRWKQPRIADEGSYSFKLVTIEKTYKLFILIIKPR